MINNVVGGGVYERCIHPAHAYRPVAIIVALSEAEPRFFKANISEGQYAPERV